MVTENLRYQHPVGQGFFHSGLLTEGGVRQLSYVYDCGAMQRYANERIRQIDRHIGFVGARSTLDLLFLSHIHADHLNGVERLLDRTTGLQVDTIVLPLTDIAERLIAFGRAAAEDRASAQNGFYRDFIIDPGAALARFGPRQIIFVGRGDRDGGAPDGFERPLEPPDGPDVHARLDAERGLGWKLVGRGAVSREPFSPGTSSSPLQLKMPDTIAIAAAIRRGAWLLAPFVDPTIASHRNAFLGELVNQLSIARKRLTGWLAVTNNIRTLVTTELDKLAAAYDAVTGDLNITSLCLYSGPAPGLSHGLARHYEAHFGPVWHGTTGPDTRIGWLGTGDASLKHKQRRADFLAHYGKLLDQVVTLTLPHHGSNHNFDSELLEKCRPAFCVAAADRFGKWNHPGANVVQAVASHPAVLQTVTSAIVARAWERATLG